MLVEFALHDGACHPTEGMLKDVYYPRIPPGNLFAFENEDKFVLTCAPDQAIIYQVCVILSTTIYSIAIYNL